MKTKAIWTLIGFFLGAVSTCCFWEFLDPRYKRPQLEQEYEKEVANGKRVAEEEDQEQLTETLNERSEFEKGLLLWQLKTNLGCVLEIKDWQAKTLVREQIAAGDRIIPPGRYDYFSFVRCPKSTCAIAIAYQMNGECFLVHFTGSVPDKKRGIAIEGNRVAFY